MLKPVVAEQIHLNQVDILKAQIDEINAECASDEQDFSSDLVFQMRILAEQEIVYTLLALNIAVLNGHESIANSSFKFSFHFQIEHLSDFLEVQPQEKIIICERNLASTLAAISFSTVRGILLTQFRGTIFKNFILPIINPEKLLTEKLIIST
jgi:hypothetical protein